jgi:8-oxo-dGTP pyrophosphatase MutT (NUDIX family)
VSTFAGRLAHALFLAVKSGLAPVAVGVNALVLGEAGRVLLVRHGYQTGWRLPGGGVDPGETPATAIRRELEEELGLAGGTVALIGHYARKVLWMGHMVVLYRIDGASIAFHPNFEIRAICWADPASPPPDTSPATLRRLAELAGAPVTDAW